MFEHRICAGATPDSLHWETVRLRLRVNTVQLTGDWSENFRRVWQYVRGHRTFSRAAIDHGDELAMGHIERNQAQWRHITLTVGTPIVFEVVGHAPDLKRNLGALVAPQED